MSYVYRIEGTVAVTFYVRAETPEEAAVKAHAYVNNEPPEVSSAHFDSPNLPEVSISPAMTVLGIESNDVECVDELAQKLFPNTTKEIKHEQ